MTASRDTERLIRAFLDEGDVGAALSASSTRFAPTSTEPISGSSSARGGHPT